MSAELQVEPGGYRPLLRAVNAVLAGPRRLGAFPVDAERLCRTAERSTGLSDYGGDDFRVPLERLMADFAQTPPTALGQLMVHASLAQALANRLRLQAVPRAPDAQAPIIIVGWHRSGTTLLQQLLDAVPGLGHVPLYRLVNPVPRAGDLLRAIAATRAAWAIAPEMRWLHPQAVRGPEECWMLLMASMRVDGFTLHWTVPRYTEWLDQADMTPAYALYAKTLALLQSQRPGETLVMKDPGHLACLPSLLRAVPTARLVWTHRDPVDCVASFASLSAVHHRSIYGRYDPHRAGATSLQRLVNAVHKGLAARSTVPAGQLFDLAYPELVADPVGAVARICEAFGIPFDAYGRASVTEALHAARASHRKHAYSPERWGLAPDAIRRAVSGYDPAAWR